MLSLTKKALEELDNQHDFERMCADILHGIGYEDVVLMAPRGGADGGRDISFRFDNNKHGLACVTLRDNIAAKFKEDFYQRKPGSDDDQPYLMMRTLSDELVGFNKNIPGRRGRIEFEYQILSSTTKEMNIAFYMIPIEQRWNENFIENLEINENEQPSLRQAFIPPTKHTADNQWHKASFSFDFRDLPSLLYLTFAPRINECREEKGSGCVYISKVQIFS
ncbi:hypothetical protein [Kouleothrix sp.]|uniref:hypothetical protein n=1 Tax=Kouleothrix sp. TaxID=2779161 RepID=UPI00391A91E2